MADQDRIDEEKEREEEIRRRRRRKEILAKRRRKKKIFAGFAYCYFVVLIGFFVCYFAFVVFHGKGFGGFDRGASLCFGVNSFSGDRHIVLRDNVREKGFVIIDPIGPFAVEEKGRTIVAFPVFQVAFFLIGRFLQGYVRERLVVMFEENEALTHCAFCGRKLVRTSYLDTEGLPECVIPFRLTLEEAKDCLEKWCHKNRKKSEARVLLSKLKDLKGFYLPYELVQGPVHMQVSRMDGGSTYACEGFISDTFVNRSKQLDNLLLDGMEPYDLNELRTFDFAYVAGQRVKISDLSDDKLEARVREETAKAYQPFVRDTFNTKAVDITTDVTSAVRLPVLLPVYYICDHDVMAVVNGQTGKVSIRAAKESHYYFLPWWLKALVATLVFCCVAFGAFRLLNMTLEGSLLLTGILGIFFVVVTLALYSDTTQNSFAVESGYEIFTSGEKSFKRERGQLVLSDEILERKVVQPVYFWTIKGEKRPVTLRFVTPLRVIRMALLCLIALFLPVIIALFLNGFDFARLELGGSAAWFCIAVPVVPIYLLKLGIVELYHRPWIYITSKRGKKKRYRKTFGMSIDKEMVIMILRALFIPPVSLAVWFAIICFFMMCYLTAFGF